MLFSCFRLTLVHDAEHHQQRQVFEPQSGRVLHPHPQGVKVSRDWSFNSGGKQLNICLKKTKYILLIRTIEGNNFL